MSQQAVTIDSRQLFENLLKMADLDALQQQLLLEKFESAVYSRTLKILLTLLPPEQQRKLEHTMHFQPDFFLNRVLAILQAYATVEQITEVMDKAAEEAFIEFFDNFIQNCSQQQKLAVDAYLGELDGGKTS